MFRTNPLRIIIRGMVATVIGFILAVFFWAFAGTAHLMDGVPSVSASVLGILITHLIGWGVSFLVFPSRYICEL